MEDKGYGEINDFRGKLLENIVPGTELEFEPPVVSEVDKDTCIGCGNCVDVCPYDAIEMSQGKALVSKDACDGCGTCVWICPVDALSMKRTK